MLIAELPWCHVILAEGLIWHERLSLAHTGGRSEHAMCPSILDPWAWLWAFAGNADLEDETFRIPQSSCGYHTVAIVQAGLCRQQQSSWLVSLLPPYASLGYLPPLRICRTLKYCKLQRDASQNCAEVPQHVSTCMTCVSFSA